ncbi:MAG: FitA-like ribbon-helix-helix domain-containing protein [Bradymonadia bacterium]
MTQLTIHKLDDALVRALRVRAAERGHSIEAEVRAILHEVLMSRPDERALVDHILAMPTDATEEDPFPRLNDVCDVIRTRTRIVNPFESTTEPQ